MTSLMSHVVCLLLSLLCSSCNTVPSRSAIPQCHSPKRTETSLLAFVIDPKCESLVPAEFRMELCLCHNDRVFDATLTQLHEWAIWPIGCRHFAAGGILSESVTNPGPLKEKVESNEKES